MTDWEQFLSEFNSVSKELKNVKDLNRKLNYVFNIKDSIVDNDIFPGLIDYDFFLNPELWRRNIKDFTYLVNVYKVLSNPSERERYNLNNNSPDTIRGILYDENGNLREAGLNTTFTDTVWSKIEQSSGDIPSVLLRLFDFNPEKEETGYLKHLFTQVVAEPQREHSDLIDYLRSLHLQPSELRKILQIT